MKTFNQFLSEIAANPYAQDIVSKPSSMRGLYKLEPKKEKPSISIRLGYGTYNVFKRYINEKFSLANDLLDRRGDSVSIVNVLATNEEIANLIELARYIINNASDEMPNRPSYTNKQAEIYTAQKTIEGLENTMAPRL